MYATSLPTPPIAWTATTALRPMGSTAQQLRPVGLALKVPPLHDIRQQQVQQQRDRGENLYQEVMHHDVERLESKKAQLEQSLLEAQQAPRRLEAELEQMRHRCAELERLVHVNTPVVAKADENEDLRKQLAAYAVEIDMRRSDTENEHADLRRQLAAYAVEIDTLRREQANAEDTLRDIQQDHQAELDHMTLELQEAHSVIQRLRSERFTEANHEDRDHREVPTNEYIQDLVNANESLRAELTSLQEECEKQVREFSDMVASMRKSHQEASSELAGAGKSIEEDERLAATLRKQIEDLHAEASRAAAQQDETLQSALSEALSQRDALQSQLSEEEQHRAALEEQLTELRASKTAPSPSSLLPKASRAQNAVEHARATLFVAQEHTLRKLSDKRRKNEPRIVTVSAPDLMLKWAKLPQGCGPIRKKTSQLDLKEVTYIDYGITTQAFRQNVSSALPWLCFSLHVASRSFDFLCPDEESAQHYLLALSELCDGACGRIMTRSSFASRKGWCKVQHHCMQRRKSFLSAVLELRRLPTYRSSAPRVTRSASRVSSRAASRRSDSRTAFGGASGSTASIGSEW